MQRRVFLAIRAGAFSNAAIAAAVGITSEAATKACQYLKARRLIEVEGGRMRGKWRALPGASPPEDRRGKPKRCRNHRGAKARHAWVKMMRSKHGASWRPPLPPLPVDPSPLAQCWRIPVAWEPRA